MLYMKYNILPPDQNFRGRSYGEWAGDWWNWVISEDPDTYSLEDPIAFLRANLDYTGIDNERHQTGTNFSNKIEIRHGVAIFFPVIECGWFEKEVYRGKTATRESDMRQIVREDVNSWNSLVATINDETIVDNILDFRIESPLFKLVVPENSKLRKRMETILPVGTWNGVTEGYYILIQSLPISRYVIHFGGGNGVLSYYGTYDIKVL